MRDRVTQVMSIVSSIVVTLGVLVMVGFYFHERGSPTENGLPAYVEGWENWREAGIRVGPQEPVMVVTGFMDLTCPYCGQIVPVIDSLLQLFPDDVAFDFVHFPLRGREFAIPSAVAVECAAQQGRFRQMYQVLYAQMDSVGVKPWKSLASEAGVADLEWFDRCLEASPESFPAIGAGQLLGAELGVFATPTVWVNGRRFTARDLPAFVERARELGVGG